MDRQKVQDQDTIKEGTALARPPWPFSDHRQSSTGFEDWGDFRSCNASEFKKNYKKKIQKPLSRLLNESRVDPNVQMPRELKESMFGIIRSLINYYVDLLSQPSFQKSLKLRERIGDQSTPKAAWIHFPSMTNLFKTCVSIMSTNKLIKFPSIETVQYVEETFDDPAFSPQMLRIHMGAVPGHCPLVVSWQIHELISTSLPDNFMEAKVVPLSAEEELKAAPELAKVASPELMKLEYLLTQMRYLVYANETCASCNSSVVKELRKCPACKVAMYCGEGCQKKHWSIHKQDCDNLREIRLEALVFSSLIDFLGESYRVYAPGNCSSCDISPGPSYLSKCAVCKVARYCGRECQKKHWSVHKHHCKRLCDHRKEVTKKAEDEEAN